MKRELGELLPLATDKNKGLMSKEDKVRMGRIFRKGYCKLAESSVWYNHYSALIYGASPASSNGVLIAIDWRGTHYSATRLNGVNGNVKLFTGDNPNTEKHELWLGLTENDGDGSEFIIRAAPTIDWNSGTTETLPSYLSEITIS